MLLSVMKNSALAAKVRAMTKTTLHRADYDALIQLHSVPAVASYLMENTRYQKSLQNVSPSTLHRGQLEQLLKNQTAQDVMTLLHYTDMDSTFFLKALEMQEGIETLKVFLRLLHIGHPEQIALQAQDIRIGKDSIKMSDLAEIRSFSGFLELIRPTPYYAVFRTFADDPRRQELFYLEVALDSYWAKLICRYAKKYLSDEDAKLALKVYGTEIDLDNLIFLLRCKERFQMDDDEIYACVIPSYYRLTPAAITEIVSAPTIEAALKLIAERTPYGDAFSESDRFFEKRKNDYMARLNRRIYANHPYSLQAAISYAHLRHIEINNIVSIIEGIRYGLPPDAILSHLVGYAEGGPQS